jgi:hypothetical protein
MGGGIHIEPTAVVGHTKLDSVVVPGAADAAQPDGDSGRLGVFMDVAQELLRRPVKQRGGLPVHFHSMMGRLKMHGDSTFPQREGQPINRPRDAKHVEIDRMRIGKNATDCDDIVAY